MKTSLNILSIIALIAISIALQPLVALSLDMAQWERRATELASDSMFGRGSGQIGGEKAADYLVNEINNIGLLPLDAYPSYRQPVSLISCVVSEETSLMLSNEQGNQKMVYGEDYLLYNKCSLSDIEYATDMRFLGFGIISPEHKWDDYKNIDLSGKIAVILEGMPIGVKMENHLWSIATKQELAYRAGAEGVLFVPLIQEYKEWLHLGNHLMSESQKLSYSMERGFSAVLNPFSLEKIGITLKEYAYYHSAEYKKNNKKTELNSKLSFHSGLDKKEFTSDNIIAQIPPKEGSNEYILVSAHYDHLGIGNNVGGDSIYNGFYDNAMGVASLLTLAEEMLQDEKRRRGIIFLFTTAEEKGLLGSRYFTDHPPVELNRIVSAINVDGIAPFGVPKEYFALGAEYSDLGEKIKEITSESNVDIVPLSSEFGPEDHFRFSDQFSFALAGIPSIMLVDGLEYEGKSRQEIVQRIQDYTINNYHDPSDDVSLGYDLEGVEAHSRILYKVISELAEDDSSISWYYNSPYSRSSGNSLSHSQK